MKVVQINATAGIGSTGKICVGISEELTNQGIENYIISREANNECKNIIKLFSKPYYKLQALKSRVFANYGFNSYLSTKKIIRELNKIKPDVVHIHNIHDHSCNLSVLMNYLRKNKIKIVYTFHDCWTLTGYCTHFTFIKCDKWKTECEHCPQYKTYSWFFDRSKSIFEKKKRALLNQNMTIVTPSEWLAGLVKQSFLKDYPVKVIHNGINLDIFKPTESNFREIYNIDKNKFVILGVSYSWGIKKGIDVFIELAKRLPSHLFQIVLVGTDSNVDKILPTNIISIHTTQNQIELAKIYTACDLFVNPTREDNYPTVNMEAIACGTPVLTFRTGGSPEMLTDKTGIVVDYDDIDAMERSIYRIAHSKIFRKEDCIKSAQNFDEKIYKSV